MSKSVKVKEIASDESFVLKPSAKIIEAAKMMKENNISSIVIIAEDNYFPIGIITERDIVQRIVAEGKDPKTEDLKTHMTSPVLKIDPNAEILDAMKKMIKHKVKRLVIIKNEELDGMVSYSDIIKVSPDLLEAVYSKAKLDSFEEYEDEDDADEVTAEDDEYLFGICEICGAECEDLKENEDGLFVCGDCFEK